MSEKDAEKKEGGGGGTGSVTVVLRVDLHCEGCAHKVKRTIKHLGGVESVKADFAASKLTVVGKVDPAKVKQRVEEKTKKKVELVSPQSAKKDKDAGGGGAKKSNEKSDKKPADNGKKAEEKKPKEPTVSTVGLKTRVHCDGCAQKIKKIINKCEGVQEVNVDLAKDQITVKGTMDMQAALPYLNTKLKRVVEIAPPPKKDGGSDKKPKEGDGGGGSGDKKKGKGDANPGGGGGGGNKKEAAKPAASGSDEGSSKPLEESTSKVEVVNRMEHYGYPYGYGAHTYNPEQIQGNDYVVEYWNGAPDYNMHAPPDYLHAPQMFSDENPNACSVM